MDGLSNLQLMHEPQWVSTMNRWYADGVPFAGIIGFDPNIGWLTTLDRASHVGLIYEIDGDKKEASISSQGAEADLTWRFDAPDREVYRGGFDLIQQGIQRGDSYLANLCTRSRLHISSGLDEIFHRVSAKYKVMWRSRFLCYSPETFVEIEEDIIRTYPMKGTIDARVSNAADVLRADPKERAEHHTIVDLMRNDLAMISDHVEVERFAYVDEIDTDRGSILQMSSEIKGRLRRDTAYAMGSALYSLLPAGSISGAPKSSTLALISAAEDAVRGYYTGIFVHYDGRRLQSAVMIRFIHRSADGTYWYHSGGGITSRSQWQQEYDEVIKKIYLPIYRDHTRRRR